MGVSTVAATNPSPLHLGSNRHHHLGSRAGPSGHEGEDDADRSSRLHTPLVRTTPGIDRYGYLAQTTPAATTALLSSLRGAPPPTGSLGGTERSARRDEPPREATGGRRAAAATATVDRTKIPSGAAAPTSPRRALPPSTSASTAPRTLMNQTVGQPRVDQPTRGVPLRESDASSVFTSPLPHGNGSLTTPAARMMGAAPSTFRSEHVRQLAAQVEHLIAM